MNNLDISKVYLLDVPLENDYKNTIYFNNEEEQQAYFQSRIARSFEDVTYQRKDKIFRCCVHADTIYNTNYVMYQNPKFSNKWFYAFITDIEYVNDECTYIHIQTDVIQTWMFTYTILPSFVEREHVSVDGYNYHTMPEGLETGEYICNFHKTDEQMDELLKDLKYVVSSTVNADETAGDSLGESVSGGRYNGIYSGSKYYVYDAGEEVGVVLRMLAVAGKVDGVNGVFMAPSFLVPKTGNVVNNSNHPSSYNIKMSKQNTLDGYTPHNKKLLCFPYNYLVVSNNNGGSCVYNYENFTGDSCGFRVVGALTPGCSIRMIPVNYKSSALYHEEAINLGKFPICNYSCDMYTNWLTQNSVNIALQEFQGGVKLGAGAVATIAGVATLNPTAIMGGVGTMYSGATDIANTMAQVHQQSFTPPQARGNLNCGDVITADSENNFHFYAMSIKKEFAKMIDNYFDMFGYKVNRVKVPNKCHRSRWWYTKTIGINIDGELPNKDLQMIKNVYDNGITFWRNPYEIQHYDLTNDIAITEGAIEDDI